MRILGRSILAFVRSFHFWHKHHIEFSLGLLVIAGIGIAISYFGWATPEAARLPAEIEHWLGIFTGIFFAIYLLLITVGKLAARFWPPSVVPVVTSMPEPEAKPSSGHWLFRDAQGNRYRFRYATPEDLEMFNSLAMGDPAIVLTYSYLDTRDWRELYRRWQAHQRENLINRIKKIGQLLIPD